MRPPEEVKKKLVRQWLAKADDDVKACEALLALRPPLLYPTCFHAQQAAEKYIKAILTWYQIEFPKTHSIKQLLDLAEPAQPGLINGLKDAVMLTPYGVDIRYPSGVPEPDMQEAEQALKLASKVRDAVMKYLKGII
ncbi:MAG: HEPN domain-containing protein [Candidatus Magnetobacterium sp. LHC-1]|uniref:HEPN domain-containing protein n=1 Tax=Candidatus Magnetobacterium casense TaxID=1455061 RepID=A0ABS6RZ98_9BACT|nr:HEPN domain-containing protein [Candidatus Magnetobacterium casensis]MBF0607038.1 HEPN domain-containing protein [Nitrospirota bacterium]MBV6341975.1 HEPN domain-containing protein [Candidatus Magnetobacterium casensis]